MFPFYNKRQLLGSWSIFWQKRLRWSWEKRGKFISIFRVKTFAFQAKRFIFFPFLLWSSENLDEKN
jgi:hypothetical protein